jgi:hypothetical protein
MRCGLVDLESGWCFWISPRPLRWWSFYLLLPGYWVACRNRLLWTHYIGVGPVLVALTDLAWEVAT